MVESKTGKRAPFAIEWREGFKVGIDQVDGEHKRLFALVKGLNLESVDDTLDELLEYVVTHFSNEQALMEESDYPAFDQHLKLHEEFGTQVADFLGGSDGWTDDRMQELRRFLNKWLIGHIMTHDLRFGKWHARHVGHDAAHRTVNRNQRPGLLARLFGLR